MSTLIAFHPLALDPLAVEAGAQEVLARMRRRRWLRTVSVGVLALLAILAGSRPARALGVPDGLQCYKATDTTLRRLRGTIDLDAPSIGVAPGCKISKAKLYCVAASQQTQPGTLFDGSDPLTEVPYHGRPAETDRICYRVRCPSPVGTAGDRTAVDRFGVHELRRLKTDMVCTPATGGTQPPLAEGFQVTSPPIVIDPGQDVTWCYFFRTPNLATLAVKRFASSMGPAGRGVVFFTTSEASNLGTRDFERRPAGEVSIAQCELFTGTTRPNWRFAGYGPSDELAFPTDDGNGHPVAMELSPMSAGVLMMHFKNETSSAVSSSVTLTVDALDGAVYTPTATLLSYDATISIPGYATGKGEAQSCSVPAGVRFWNLTTFAHKQAVRTNVLDGANVLFDSVDWAHPGTTTWSTPPFYAFAEPTLSHRCTYDNPSYRTITRGPSQQTDEQCVGIGYFFPGTTPRICWDGYVLQ